MLRTNAFSNDAWKSTVRTMTSQTTVGCSMRGQQQPGSAIPRLQRISFLTKNWRHNENWWLWQKYWFFTHFDKICWILLSDKRKMAFWRQNFFKSLFIIRSTQFRMAKKCRNLGYVAKFLTKFAFFDKWKDKWKPKASKLQDFIKLANNSCSYALLKNFFLVVKFGQILNDIWILWQTKNDIFGGKILCSLAIPDCAATSHWNNDPCWWAGTQTTPRSDVSCAVDAVGKIRRCCAVERPEDEARQLEDDPFRNPKSMEFTK